MDWPRYIRDFEAYMRLERNMSDNSVQAYLRDVEHLRMAVLEIVPHVQHRMATRRLFLLGRRTVRHERHNIPRLDDRPHLLHFRPILLMVRILASIIREHENFGRRIFNEI